MPDDIPLNMVARCCPTPKVFVPTSMDMYLPYKEQQGGTTTKKRNHHFIKDTRRSINDDAATLYSEWRSLHEEGPPHVSSIDREIYDLPNTPLVVFTLYLIKTMRGKVK